MNYWQFFSRGMLGRNGKGWPWFVLAAAAGTAGIHLYWWHSQLQHMQRELDALRARSKQSDLAVQKWIAQVQALEQKWLQFSAYFQGMMTMSTTLSIPQQHRFASSSSILFPSPLGAAAAAAPEAARAGEHSQMHHSFPRLLRPVPQQPPMLAAAAAASTALELYDDGASCKSQCGSQASDSPPSTPNVLLAAAATASSSHPPTPSLQSSHSYTLSMLLLPSASGIA